MTFVSVESCSIFLYWIMYSTRSEGKNSTFCGYIKVFYRLEHFYNGNKIFDRNWDCDHYVSQNSLILYVLLLHLSRKLLLLASYVFLSSLTGQHKQAQFFLYLLLCILSWNDSHHTISCSAFSQCTCVRNNRWLRGRGNGCLYILQ